MPNFIFFQVRTGAANLEQHLFARCFCLEPYVKDCIVEDSHVGRHPVQKCRAWAKFSSLVWIPGVNFNFEHLRQTSAVERQCQQTKLLTRIKGSDFENCHFLFCLCFWKANNWSTFTLATLSNLSRHHTHQAQSASDLLPSFKHSVWKTSPNRDQKLPVHQDQIFSRLFHCDRKKLKKMCFPFWKETRLKGTERVIDQ